MNRGTPGGSAFNTFADANRNKISPGAFLLQHAQLQNHNPLPTTNALF